MAIQVCVCVFVLLSVCFVGRPDLLFLEGLGCSSPGAADVWRGATPLSSCRLGRVVLGEMDALVS